MRTETEGIVLKRKTETANNRRMLTLFTKKYGKISAGTSMVQNRKTKSQLAFQAFTLGNYDIYKKGDFYNIDSAEAIKSFYAIGENLDKYEAGSNVLKFTEQALGEGNPSPGAFGLLVEFLELLERREKSIETLVIGYKVKLIKILGFMPETKTCTICGKPIGPENPVAGLSIEDGGVVCENCAKALETSNNQLIYPVSLVIIDIINFFSKSSLRTLEKMALDDNLVEPLTRLVADYATYHLGVSQTTNESIIRTFDI